MEELWVDKYKPRSLEELAVHKKKVTIKFFKFDNINGWLIFLYFVYAGWRSEVMVWGQIEKFKGNSTVTLYRNFMFHLCLNFLITKTS